MDGGRAAQRVTSTLAGRGARPPQRGARLGSMCLLEAGGLETAMVGGAWSGRGGSAEGHRPPCGFTPWGSSGDWCSPCPRAQTCLLPAVSSGRGAGTWQAARLGQWRVLRSQTMLRSPPRTLPLARRRWHGKAPTMDDEAPTIDREAGGVQLPNLQHGGAATAVRRGTGRVDAVQRVRTAGRH
jgi:hypothetical protein